MTVLACILKSSNDDYNDVFPYPNLKGVIIVSTGIKSWPISNKITYMININIDKMKIIDIPSLHAYGD
jgi:hypothetical protein